MDVSFARPSVSVHIAGSKYQTLPWFLGRVPTKRDKQIAQDHGHKKLVELRNGDHNTLAKYGDQSILLPNTVSLFLGHGWVHTICKPTRADRDNLQVKLVRDTKSPGSANFLWLTTSLQQAFADVNNTRSSPSSHQIQLSIRILALLSEDLARRPWHLSSRTEVPKSMLLKGKELRCHSRWVFTRCSPGCSLIVL